MDNLDDLAAIWRRQSPKIADAAPPPRPAEAILEQLAQRRGSARQSVATLTLLALGLVQIAGTVSLLAASGTCPIGIKVLFLALYHATYTSLLVYAIRRRRRNQARTAAPTSLRHDLQGALAATGAERRDIRGCATVGAGAQVLLLLVSFLSRQGSWSNPTGLSAHAYSSVAAYLTVGVIAWWYYRRVLPDRHRKLESLLDELVKG